MSTSQQEKLYKFLDGGTSTIHQHPWFLPHGKRPGKWMPIVESGYP